MNTPVKAMQQAVDIVLTSPHPGSKVAATLFEDSLSVSKTNEWPAAIVDKIGTEQRIGGSSGTLHAEVNCILNTPFKTEGARLAITDPCCPNCAKCIAEAGIKEVYIDHKGFEKDFAKRLGDEFEDMSLRILAHAGIHLYMVTRKENKIDDLYIPASGYEPPEENPIETRPCNHPLSDTTLKQTAKLVRIKHDRWACALATDKNGKTWTLVASAHPAIGYTQNDSQITEGKYDFILEPINRILMGAARQGLSLSKDHIWCSILPSPREMVNLIGLGVTEIYVGNMTGQNRTEPYEARETLETNGILKFKEMPL